jgi:TRAP-type C4-dicarboxylate transport system permease large subunit
MLVVIIIGGIYSGIFTATEAAAMSAVYAFIISVYVYGETRLKDVPRVLLRSANMSATCWSIAGCVQREANQQLRRSQARGTLAVSHRRLMMQGPISSIMRLPCRR